METKNKVRTEEYMRRKGYPPVGSHPSSISSAALSEINRLLGHWDDDRRRRKVPDWMSRYWYKHCRCSGSGTGTQASKQASRPGGHWSLVISGAAGSCQNFHWGHDRHYERYRYSDNICRISRVLLSAINCDRTSKCRCVVENQIFQNFL
jgi:hypothetical protein